MSRSGTKNGHAEAGEEAPIVERVSRDRGTRGGKGNRGILGRSWKCAEERTQESRRSNS